MKGVAARYYDDKLFIIPGTADPFNICPPQMTAISFTQRNATENRVKACVFLYESLDNQKREYISETFLLKKNICRL